MNVCHNQSQNRFDCVRAQLANEHEGPASSRRTYVVVHFRSRSSWVVSSNNRPKLTSIQALNAMNSLVRYTARCLRSGAPCSLPVDVEGRWWTTSRRLLCAAAGAEKDVDVMVKKDKVVVFMKGTPAQPLCGFSNAVVQILRMHGVDEYAAYNVLEDQELREGVKVFSNWPTIPQVYFNGEFVGGCDILLQMHQNGDLVEELKKLGVRSALTDADKDSK
ncbi:glutaredoxin-related protein 5, mitochondrial-like [Entelurus aequoreus]|uniref:glutaredoxin-related protein 5, mitochondrial-like n=1 Tax=Entelurus aequoreus TaxID=161455 RepID=UPI002B1CEBD4|nr:glutaredoxin-related protein 5, mitochondrial-like [Entelurus aequoreus]